MAQRRTGNNIRMTVGIGLGVAVLVAVGKGSKEVAISTTWFAYILAVWLSFVVFRHENGSYKRKRCK